MGQKQKKIGSGNQSHDKRTETTETTGPGTEAGTGIEIGTKRDTGTGKQGQS